MSRNTECQGIYSGWPFEAIGIIPPELQACHGCVRLMCSKLGIHDASKIILEIDVRFLSTLEKAINHGIQHNIPILPPDLAMIKEACRNVSKRLEEMDNAEVFHQVKYILSKSDELCLVDGAHSIQLSKDAVNNIGKCVQLQPFPFF